MKSKTPEELKLIMSERAHQRWSKTTKRQRSNVGYQLADARKKKKKSLSLMANLYHA